MKDAAVTEEFSASLDDLSIDIKDFE